MSPAESDVLKTPIRITAAHRRLDIERDCHAGSTAAGAGEWACLRVWERMRGLDPQRWLAGPCIGDAAGSLARQLVGEPMPGDALYAEIAREAERALDNGARCMTPLAFVLLAAIALNRLVHSDAAVRLGHVALELAARDANPHLAQVSRLHAALIVPYTDELGRMAASLSAWSGTSALAPPIGTLALGAAFVAGAPLPELTCQLERFERVLARQRGSACAGAGVAASLGVLRGLVSPQAAARPAHAGAPDTASDAVHERGFGYWLAQLQGAWFGCERQAAEQALRHAAALAGPLTPAMERLTLHLFAALVLAEAREPAALERLRAHCSALSAWAASYPASGLAMSELACALCSARRNPGMPALRGYESAAAIATRHGQHGIAALAWEQAALLVQAAGLASALRHYRSQALASYQHWGALGRVDTLLRRWSEAGAPPALARTTDEACPKRAGAVGELGLSIAHEVNQPLAAITLHAAAARKWLRRDAPDIERALASLALIGAAGRHAGDIVRSVQRLAARQENELHVVSVDQGIGAALQLLRQPLRRHAIEVELALGLGECTIRANRTQLQQVVMNLLMNAIESLARSAAGQRRIRIESRRDADHVEVMIADNGPGIAEADRGRMFTSLFSTKPKNTGMGLSISLSIIRAHGGRIEFTPSKPRGACFRFRLPIEPVAEAAYERV